LIAVLHCSHGDSSRPEVTGHVLIHADRLIILSFFVCVAILAVRAPGRADRVETAL
jgi:hypothetical protein